MMNGAAHCPATESRSIFSPDGCAGPLKPGVSANGSANVFPIEGSRFDDSSVAEPLAPDLRPRELLALAPLLLLILWIGVRPAAWMDKVDATVAQLARPPVIALIGANYGD